MPPSRSGLTAVLDIGSSKIVCVALAPERGPAPRWIGLGLRPADGIKGGEVVEPAAAEAAILSAIADAERSAGVPIEALVVGLGCGRMATVRATAAVRLDPTIVRDEDVRRVLAGACAYAERDGRRRLHDVLAGYRLDGVASVAPPIARFGRRLELDMVSITADDGPMSRLVAAVEASGVPVVSIIPLPLAGAMSVTTAAERTQGVTVVDFGAGLTSMTSFVDGQLARVETIACGGRQLTQRAASVLQVPFISAERIKHDCASVVLAHAGDADTTSYRPDSGSNADARLAADLPLPSTAAMRGVLDEIVAAHVDSVLRHVADHLDAASYAAAGSWRVVLTGGASQLHDLPAYTAQILGRPVRLGTPPAVAGLAATGLPPFAAVAGLALLTGWSESAPPEFGSVMVARRRVA